MKKMYSLIKVVFAFLFACVVSFNFVVDQAMATGQFSRTCDQIEVNNGELSAVCKTRNGNLNKTSINLDEYIGNLDGVLSWGDHNFSQTCDNIALASSFATRQLVVAAECRERDQDINYTDIALDDHIANIDGKLQYE